jgi:Tfp pilus assembly protein PilF
VYERALQGYEEAFEPNHPSTLDTVNNLGALYASQDKLDEAEETYERALQGYKNRFGSDYPRCRSVQRALGML